MDLPVNNIIVSLLQLCNQFFKQDSKTSYSRVNKHIFVSIFITIVLFDKILETRTIKYLF